LPDEKRFVPDFQLVVDGAAADPELKGSVLGIRVTDDMDKASRFWVHLSDVGRKWTRQDKFKPGTAVEIKLGYQGQLKSVCKGEISNIEMVLTPDGPTRLILAGVDKGHSFDRGTVTKTYKDVKDSDLACQIAQRHGLSTDTDDSKVVHDYVIQNNLSDYDFLMERAAIAGFRVYVDDKKLLFKKPKLGEPPAAKLIWRENIGRFVQEVNTFDQVSKITTSGWDPKQAKEMTGPGKGGDEYGKQGGTVTGAQLVKQMFGEVEQVLPVATGQKNLLEAVAKSEFNKRAGVFVHAEARVTGDPAIRAGAVVQVEKAGKRVDGQYYVVSTDHLFFVDTGYATELRAKRYTIKKGASPVKDLGKFAKAVQDAAKKAQEIADRIKDAAAWALKAAREAAKRASQALEAAKQVWQDVKAALDQVKKGAGDVADAALKSVEGRLAGLRDYLGQAMEKVGEAAQEAANATQEIAREALTQAHQAAAQVADIAAQAVKHAKDAYDAVKAAALDAVHTSSDPSSSAVQGLKSSLLAAAETAVNVGKAGMTLAQAAILKGKSAIEMCAASAVAAAKPLVEGLGGELSKLIDAVKASGDAAGAPSRPGRRTCSTRPRRPSSKRRTRSRRPRKR
jgi:Bacteriophage probable baseplate hub protein